MAEDQALDRVHRMGQKNNVVTTRYIVANSIDEVPAICVCFLYIWLLTSAGYDEIATEEIAVGGGRSRQQLSRQA